MELGEKIRQTRLAAGLSQRQLCGEEITRNMLSQIEHGTARPSTRTLQYLASRLGKPVSYFLEETAVVSPNSDTMDAARNCFDAEDWLGVLTALESYQSPDPVYDRERQLLNALSRLSLARQALERDQKPYARSLLEGIPDGPGYCQEDLKRRKLLLMGRLSDSAVSDQLPSLDEELLLRARDALSQGNSSRAVGLLEAVEDQQSPQWFLLRGELHFLAEEYAQAAQCFHGAEAEDPRHTAEKLEICYRELGDYKRAYEYACKQKK